VFSEVVVGVDFGPGGDAALALALRLGAGHGRLTLTNIVLSDPTVLRGERDAMVAAERLRTLSLLDRERALAVLDRGGDSPLRIETCALIAASAGRGLLAVAVRRRADLIAVGESGHRGLARVLLGDATRRVLRGAACAVAVAPRGYTPDRDLDLLVLDDQRSRRSTERRVRRAARPVLVVRPRAAGGAGG
jgi:nucleotide-binding universal stress UspA family protein